MPGDDIVESPALVRTGSEAYAHSIQNPNPANDAKIQDMMGFLDEDDRETDCFFGMADQLSRKKSNTIGAIKRPSRVQTKGCQFLPIEEDQHLESENNSAGLKQNQFTSIFGANSRYSGASGQQLENIQQRKSSGAKNVVSTPCEKHLKTFQNALADHENNFDAFFTLQKTKSGTAQSFGASHRCAEDKCPLTAQKPQIQHRKSEMIELEKGKRESN